ncbi:hypothetical protein DFJ58DRAFT_270107 [Suillus subalutaceus]|uniref:uncharacterized protein n=1 Tax=Suillus subalutaceus TaxID=48586 RepID=UPI001B87C0F8|nr:uncharacterized protein DFJ58DRAFT_270107 [Suillus subalutaceus]KAG1860675.1 hypothetical protein DFJ58DRAFT_270107 [Suillus subalutaceus]
MQPGIYKFINRQSGTAMDLAKNDYTHVVGSPPCDDSIQMWEIARLGAGHSIRNMQTGTYMSAQGIQGGATILAGHFPVAWQLITMKVDDENAEMIEIRWPLTGYMFDLHRGFSAPGTKIHLWDHQLNAVDHRCRLWKPVFIRDIHHSVLPERAGEDDETSSTTTISAADVPEGGELVLVTTTTTRTVVTKVPKQWSKGLRA